MHTYIHTYMYNNCLLKNKKILTFRNHWIFRPTAAHRMYLPPAQEFFSALTNKRLERV